MLSLAVHYLHMLKTTISQACAHRHRILNVASSYSWGKGLCILFRNNLEADQLMEPCSNYVRMRDFKHQQCECLAGTSVSITSVSPVHSVSSSHRAPCSMAL